MICDPAYETCPANSAVTDTINAATTFLGGLSSDALSMGWIIVPILDLTAGL